MRASRRLLCRSKRAGHRFTNLPGYERPCFCATFFSCRNDSKTLVIESANGQSRVLPLAAADITIERMSSDWLHIFSASSGEHWALHLTQTICTYRECLQLGRPRNETASVRSTARRRSDTSADLSSAHFLRTRHKRRHPGYTSGFFLCFANTSQGSSTPLVIRAVNTSTSTVYWVQAFVSNAANSTVGNGELLGYRTSHRPSARAVGFTSLYRQLCAYSRGGHNGYLQATYQIQQPSAAALRAAPILARAAP